MLSIFILFLALQPSFALIGYDCGSRSLNITTLSLLDVGPCDIPNESLNVTMQYIQLLQIQDFVETKVIQ